MTAKRPEPPSVPNADRLSRRSALDTGFERWLNGQLHKLYDPVLDEAVPDELARLLEGFDERPGEGDPPGDGRAGEAQAGEPSDQADDRPGQAGDGPGEEARSTKPEPEKP